ncbi:MAG: peptidoglycan DD-metalloendopeptidase family protein [Candidatus Eisenbacteria bacterium]
MRLLAKTYLISMIAIVVGFSLSPCRGQEEAMPSREEIEEEMRLREDEIQRIREDLRDKKQKAAELAGREHDLLGDMERINEEIRINKELLSKLGQQKAVLFQDLEIANEDLLVAESSFRQASDLLSERVRAIYKFGRGEMMEVVLMSKTFADLAKRIYYLSVVADHDREIMSAFERRVETRRILREHIEAKKSRIEGVEREVQGETRNLELRREERDAVLRQLKEKRYYYESLADKLEEASKNLEALLGRLEERRETVRYTGTSFGGRMGNLMWPCEGEVVSGFGVETHPRFGTIIRNNGINIRALPGSKVRSVGTGTVSFAGALSGFGNGIVISHGDGFYTLYGHLESLLVGAGYDVKEGDAIGFIGETSTPEGAVLHFEIRKGKEPLDPAGWLLK